MNSRRSFLAGALTLGAGAFFIDPFRAVTESIVDSFISRAEAEALGLVNAKNYINIQMAGAPIRYQFDQFLRTSKNDIALQLGASGKPNPMTCDAFSFNNNGTVSPIMKGFTYNNVIVPHLWSQSVFTQSGSQRPLTDLLKHMLVIRGYGSGLDGHQFNLLGQQAPIGGVSTLGGLVSENASSTFDSVQFPDRGSNGAFYSSFGKSQTKLSGGTPLGMLMEGFDQPTNKLSRNLKATHAEAMDLAQRRMKAYARSSARGSEIVNKNMLNANEMMAKGIGNVASFYTPAVNRYIAAIEKSMRAINIPGISEKSIVSDESTSWSLGTADIFILHSGQDARSALAKASIQNFAQGLAVTEYLIKEGLVSSIDIVAGALLNIEAIRKGQTAITKLNLGHDMHTTGSNSAILFMNAFYRGLTAGLLELITQIGPKAWENTVIQIQGDFGRTARSNGSGSDHGYDQMVTSVFSGAFNNGPFVVGNIKQAGHNANYEGTQGIAAPISGYNQKGAPTPVAAASTVAEILGTSHNPYKNTAAPLVSLNGGKLSTKFPGKIVA